MRIHIQTRSKGGSLKRALRRSLSAQRKGVKAVDVGFFDTARYPDGTAVTNVAAWNEFGTKFRGRDHVPPRPFFRNSNQNVQKPLARYLANETNPKDMILTPQMGERVGLILQRYLQESITNLKDPPNAPETIRRKQGKANPLIDTGKLRTSATYRVHRNNP